MSPAFAHHPIPNLFYIFKYLLDHPSSSYKYLNEFPFDVLLWQITTNSLA